MSYSRAIGLDNTFINNEFDKGQRDEIQSKTNGMMFLSLLFSGIIGAALFSISAELVFIVSIIPSVMTIFLTRQVEITEELKTNSSKAVDINSVKTHKINYFMSFYYGISRGIVLSLFVGLIPFMLLEKNLNNIEFVLMLSAYTLSGNVMSRKYKEVKLNVNTKVVMSIGLIFIGLASLSYNTTTSILTALILFGLGAGFTRPITFSKMDTTRQIKFMETIYFIVNISIMIIYTIILK